MDTDKIALALYFVGLAIVQKTGIKYVNREIEIAINALQKQLNLK
ncbi:hypothetical protein [Bacillus sp. DNRA2]|nr:hypothetical protein [Bacillus sp. DNRA2]